MLALTAAAATVYLATAYSVGCGAGAGTYTSSGTKPRAGYTLAADPNVLRPGTLVRLGVWPGVWRVEDTGRAIKGLRLDLFVASCDIARQWGRRRVEVRVVGYRKPHRLKKSLAPWKRKR
jgi:3D (Asp-Asp-Asp) domain-containing protein